MTAVSLRLPSESIVRKIIIGLLKSPGSALAFITVLAIIALALFGPSFAPQDPYDLMSLNIMDSRLPPGSEGFNGNIYLLGTDAQGRDMLSAMIYGLRTSLAVGVTSGFLALAVGVVLGLIAVQSGGRIDALIMRSVDILLGFPTLLVALVTLALLGQGVGKVIFALVLVQWAYYARTIRAAALIEQEKEYVEAARCLGNSKSRILFRHILPNCLAPLIVVATLQIASAIATEATLSFLGVGLPITQPSLGLLIANGYQVLLAGLYWISLYPGILLFLLVFTINIVGDRIRDILNPRIVS